MSSDGKDSGAVWQGPISKTKLGQLSQSISQEKPLGNAQPSRNDAYAVSVSLPQEHDDAEEVYDEQDQPAVTPADTTKGFFRLWFPVLIPLILGGLTSLLVLPLIAENHANVSPENLWLIVATIIVVTITEIVTLFYTNENRGLRVSTIIGGIFLFALVGVFAIFGPTAGFITFVVLLALTMLAIRYYFHPVMEGFVDVVYAFGKYSRTLYAGPNMLLPWEKPKHQLKVSERQWFCPLQRVQLSPIEDVLLRAIVSYQLHPQDAYLAVTQVNDWEKQFQDLFITEVQTVGTMFVPEDFIPWQEGLHTPSSAEANADSLARRERINDYLYQQVRDRAALWGIIVHWVGIRDVMIAPHGAEIDTEVLLATPSLPDAVEQHQATTQPDSALQQTATQPTPALQSSTPSIYQQKTQTPPKLSESSPSVDQHAQTSPPKILKEEILVKAYKEVQDGKVTDPLAIREIAANFRAIASDPEARERVSFDAERAAQNLYEQANKYEERYFRKQHV
jgi:hypothetical protein